MNFVAIKNKYFKSTEEIVSMFLGLVIVVVVGSLIFNYFQKNKGTIDIPGASTEIKLTDVVGDRLTVDGEKVYEVVKGDSLWKIAVKEYDDGYAWVKIAAANNFKNASVIEVGQKIVLPKLESKTVVSSTKDLSKGSSVSQGGEYKVVKGDSLWKIAVRAYGDGYQWTKIWQENKNKLNNPNSLEIGMMLNVPKLN
ncbi:MAG: LysM peptidoglycan-binding domain-containing protein [Candidatus Shapirobacteria bacterium]|nr:LysM peptidoglycan-binding domain-containing protein [Candidatus Shapirobacteria bacterium]